MLTATLLVAARPIGPHAELARRWAVDPAVLLVAAMAVAAFERGRARLRRARPTSAARQPVRAWAFRSGVAVAVLAVCSPLDAAADELFAWHMVQHLVLGLAAPMLVVLGRPGLVAPWLLEPAPRRRAMAVTRRWVGRLHVDRAAPTTGLAAVAVHVAVMAAWHVPPWYDAAVAHAAVHAGEHASMFAAGLSLWWVVAAGGQRRRSGLAVLELFLAGFATGAVAALLTLSPRPFYGAHVGLTGAWGLSPLEDQQLAGAIMWAPGGAFYATAAAVVFVRWLEAGTTRRPLLAGPPFADPPLADASVDVPVGSGR
jgi:putative membrane protein